MSPTSFFKFSRTSYYSPSWDETSCSTSHCEWFAFFGNHWFLFFWKIHGKFWKFTFSRFFENDHFFGSDVKLSFSISPSIKSIDTLFLPHGLSFEIFPFRKWSQIKIWTDKTFSNFNFKTLTPRKCRRPSGGRFPRTPYYSSSWDETSCSTSHWKQFFF